MSARQTFTADELVARRMCDEALRREIEVAAALPDAYASSKRFLAVARKEVQRRAVIKRLQEANPNAGRSH